MPAFALQHQAVRLPSRGIGFHKSFDLSYGARFFLLAAGVQLVQFFRNLAGAIRIPRGE